MWTSLLRNAINLKHNFTSFKCLLQTYSWSPVHVKTYSTKHKLLGPCLVPLSYKMNLYLDPIFKIKRFLKFEATVGKWSDWTITHLTYFTSSKKVVPMRKSTNGQWKEGILRFVSRTRFWVRATFLPKRGKIGTFLQAYSPHSVWSVTPLQP